MCWSVGIVFILAVTALNFQVGIAAPVYSAKQSDVLLLAQNLLNQTISQDTYVNISTELSSLALLSVSRTYLQTTEFLKDISTVFNGISTFVSAFNDRYTINEKVLRNMGVVLNSLIQWSSTNLRVQTTSSIVKSFDEVATIFAQLANFTAQLSDITIVTVQGARELFNKTGIITDNTTQTGVFAFISLPCELFNEVPANRQVIGVYFALYENPVLLQTDPSPVIVDNVTLRETIVGSPIVAATVGPGINFGDTVPLDPPVVITLGLLPQPENFSADPRSARCVSWDFETINWTTEGCTTEIVDDETFRCSCTHLTNFAVLIDICSRPQDCVPDNNVQLQLTIFLIVMYIGGAIACASLFMTVIILLGFKKLREKENTKYHVQLSIALIGMLLVFPHIFERTAVFGGCITLSVLVHYFSLASAMWMGAEALFIFRKLVLIFTITTKKFTIGVSLICWLLPLIPVLIPTIIDVANGTTPETDLIITRDFGDLPGPLCFTNNPAVLYATLVVPVFMVELLNMIILIWVTVILVRNTKRSLGRSNQKINRRASIQLISSIAAISFLFGIHWILGATLLSIRPWTFIHGVVFTVGITVFSVFQGLSLFFFFCIINKEAQESWKKFFSYCSSKSHSPRASDSAIAVSLSKKSHSEKSVSNKAIIENQQYSLDAHVYHAVNSSPINKTNTVEDFCTPTDAQQVNKVTVRRYSTKKHRHHVEEFEIAFEQQETDDET